MKRDKYNRMVGRMKAFHRVPASYKSTRHSLFMAGCMLFMSLVVSLRRVWWINKRDYYRRVLKQFSFSDRYRKELARAVGAN